VKTKAAKRVQIHNRKKKFKNKKQTNAVPNPDGITRVSINITAFSF
jgi:hypothetical protein